MKNKHPVNRKYSYQAKYSQFIQSRKKLAVGVKATNHWGHKICIKIGQLGRVESVNASSKKWIVSKDQSCSMPLLHILKLAKLLLAQQVSVWLYGILQL